MPKTWLGLWDIGQPITTTAPPPLPDLNLYTYLLHTVRQTLHFKNWLTANVAPITTLNLSQGPPTPWIPYLHQYAASTGLATTADPNTLTPAHQSSTPICLIKALHQVIQKYDPRTPLSSRLRNPNGGYTPGISNGGPESPFNSGNYSSVWFNLAPTSGPRFEMNFWDVTQSVGKNAINNPTDVVLIHWLLAQMILDPLFTSIRNTIQSTRLTLAQRISLCAPRCRELGWPVDDLDRVHPTLGDTKAPSLIRPLNFYAYKNSPLYRHLGNPDLTPSLDLLKAVAESAGSVHFKLL